MSNIRVTHSQSADNARAESTIIINPNNPQQVVAASKKFLGLHDYQFTLATAFSIDGGLTWNESAPLNLPMGATGITDPALAWDDLNNVFLLGIALNNLPKGDVTGTYIYKSTDGGATWGDAILVHQGTTDDKCWLAADSNPSSPHHGNIYAVWDRADAQASGLGFARSLDHGDNWESTAGGTVDGTVIWNFSGKPEINVAADGSIYVVFLVAEIVLLVSNDGGDTFHVMPGVSSFNEIDPILPTAGGWPVFPGGKFRVTTAPTACVIGQTVAVAWDDGRENVSRIYYALSQDGGQTWMTGPDGQPLLSGPIPNDVQHFFPQIIADPSGIIFCTYYEFGPKQGKNLIDVFVARSLDGGNTFLPVKITDQPWDPAGAPWSHHAYPNFGVVDDKVTFIGDYFGIDATYGAVYPCWTDSRDGQLELYTGIVAVPHCAFLMERSTLGQDEIDARRSLGSPVVDDAFHVVIDGLTASELGIVDSSTKLNVASPMGMTISCNGNTSATGGYGSEIQRFTFNYKIDFGATDDAFNFPGPSKTIVLNVSTHGLSASGEFDLIKQPNPFILDGTPPWLSVDLRVLSLAEDEIRFGMSCPDAASAPLFIQTLISALKNGNGKAGGEDFSNLDDKLFVFPTNKQKKKVFNFAIARVHYIGTIGAHAPNWVRVFFRLFPALTTSTAFDLNGGYRRHDADATHPNPIARAGIQGSEYITVPCFAKERIDSTSDTMDNQTDAPYNVQEIDADPMGKEVFRFFGCWLDINQPLKPDGITPNNVLPVNVDVNKDGPFQDPANPPLPVQQAIMRNHHQCLIAEIAFDPVAITKGKDPFNSDKLAQRNLSWADLPNPGVDGSRRAPNTFEIRPTPSSLPLHETLDEMMIEWGNVPAGTTAQIYLPAVDVEEILTTATRMYTTHSLTRIDGHTLQCAACGITYVPIPRGANLNFAGLLSLDFPAGIKRGQLFNVVVKQVTSAFGTTTTPPPGTPAPPATVVKTYPIKWRRILGAFQINFPVQTKALLLRDEERLLSLMKWIGEAIPADNRWYPIFQRYLGQLSDRVAGFGGNPDEILPSPDGDGRRSPGSRSLCDLLAAVIVVLGIAYLVLGLTVLAGYRQLGLLLSLAVLGVVNGVLILIAAMKGCCRRCRDEDEA
ncbi:MAG TPA: sialidase family protein [Pyrinomonadaceae bacterium]|nr:sialidase family protein [Pyrinomonadaceae bacterium]